jgi:uncharacterized alpha-E superfamily protein
LAGIMAHSMVRDESWAFLDTGCRMERAQSTLSLLSRAITTERGREVDELVVEGVLRAGESIITHRRRAAAGTGPAMALESAIDLLLLDRLNPRSVIYQAESLAANLTMLSDEASAARALRLASALGDSDIDELLEPGRLSVALASYEQEFRRLSDDLAAKHFLRQAPRRAQAAGWASPWQVTDDE